MHLNNEFSFLGGQVFTVRTCCSHLRDSCYILAFLKFLADKQPDEQSDEQPAEQHDSSPEVYS